MGYTACMRKLNDIIPPSRRKETELLNKQSAREPLNLADRPFKFPYASLTTLVAVIVLSVAALFYFSSAKVEVTPNTVSAAVQSSFTANLSTGDLPYEIITAQKIASQSVKSSGSKTVNSFASGTITIYNTQSKAQKLISNTRFTTAAGLVFRIRAAVTVPSGSTAKPGSITAKVYADKAGDSYNVGPTSFTIPGFAGTPLSSAVYARSTTAMTGGASGSVPIVDSVLEAQATKALKAALAPDLESSIQAKIPTGYILLTGAATTTYEELAPAPSATTGQVEVKEQGTVTAIVFPNTAIAKAVALSVSGLGYQSEPVTLAPAGSLVLVPTGAFPDGGSSPFTFTLSGTASLIYNVDPTRIAAAVSGKSRSAAQVAVSAFPEVKRAIIILRPFWRQTFPQDPASISVVVANP